jgi:hypothetical protein
MSQDQWIDYAAEADPRTETAHDRLCRLHRAADRLQAAAWECLQAAEGAAGAAWHGSTPGAPSFPAASAAADAAAGYYHHTALPLAGYLRGDREVPPVASAHSTRQTTRTPDAPHAG